MTSSLPVRRTGHLPSLVGVAMQRGLVPGNVAPVFEEVHAFLEKASRRELGDILTRAGMAPPSGKVWAMRWMVGLSGIGACAWGAAWLGHNTSPNLLQIGAMLAILAVGTLFANLCLFSRMPLTRRDMQLHTSEAIVLELAHKMETDDLRALIADPLTSLQSPTTARLLSKAMATLDRQALEQQAQSAPSLSERMRQRGRPRRTNACAPSEPAL